MIIQRKGDPCHDFYESISFELDFVFHRYPFRRLRYAQPVRAATDVNLAPVAEPSTSHVSRDTSLAALHDGQVPKVSHDRSKGSYGNWPSKGTQWVQYDWTAPVRTRKIDVFWWDDRAGVRLPKACRLLYWDGKLFVPVQNPSGLGVAKDQFNTTTFDAVRTTKLRLEIDANERSTGILEWKVYNQGELPNFPPSVMAGVDRIVMQGKKMPLAGQLLRAISTDTTKVTWSKTAGPGKVAFADDAALATTATFSAVGDYVLTLTARKGKMSDSSTLAVRVVARPQLDIRAAGKIGIRITIQPHDSKDKFPYTPALVERDYPKAAISLRELDSAFEPVKARVGQMNVTVQSNPLSVLVTTLDNEPLQKITFAPDGTMSFVLDDQPVLGMGEGGPKQTGDSWRTDKIELDRRGRLHPMTPWYGTGTYGSSNPVPLMVGTGWMGDVHSKHRGVRSISATPRRASSSRQRPLRRAPWSAEEQQRRRPHRLAATRDPSSRAPTMCSSLIHRIPRPS